MENIDEQLKKSIQSILNPVTEDTVNGIIEAVKYAGLESLSDLEFVQEEDLILVLKPIQRRKLVKAWSEQTFYSAKVSNSLPAQNCNWNEDHDLLLLQVYSKYKIELSRSDVEEMSVWDKITDEMRAKTSLSCDILQCLQKIFELRFKYEKYKNSDATSWTQAMLMYMKHAREAFEITKIKEEDEKTEQIVKEEKIDPPSEVCSVSSLTVPASPITNSATVATAVHSNDSSDRKSLENGASTVSTAKISSNILKYEWTMTKYIKLLQVYKKYKRELTYPDVEKLSVWNQIAAEVIGKSKFYCDGYQCCKKIEEMRSEYEKTKNPKIKNRKMAEYFDRARMIFGTTEDIGVNFSAQQPSTRKLKKCGKKNKKYRLRLLQVYARYKAEFLYPGVEERRVWQKIAHEMREIFSYDCGESVCRFDLLQLQRRYHTLKPTCVKDKNLPYFFYDAQQVFEATHNLDTSNSQAGADKKTAKYVPPHMRQETDKKSKFMKSSPNIGENSTIRVSNLTARVTKSDLQKLFEHFGPIAHIYRSENKDFAYVKFHKQEDAIRAIQVVNGYEYDLLILNVQLVKNVQANETHAES